MFPADLDRGLVNIGDLYRFHRVFKKLEKKEPVTIAFLGGSITQDCTTTKHEMCYAFRTYDWFRRKFPATEIKYVNAGIGGTTSQFGVARVDDDILSYDPDIVFVEFSVNDTNNDKFKETYESLLRHILTSKTEPAVFTFNNVQYDDGVNAQEVHNEIGMYYDLPIVSMKDSIYEEILLGKLTSSNISADNLHPNDVGHGLLADVITNLLDIILERYLSDDITETEYVVPAESCTAVRYLNAKRYRNEISSDAKYKANAVEIDTRTQEVVKDCFKKGFTFNDSTSYLEYNMSFKGLCIQFCKTYNKNSAIADVYVDDKLVATLDANFDETWGDCLYLQDIVEFDKVENHKVRIETKNYPSNCTQKFYLVSFITY